MYYVPSSVILSQDDPDRKYFSYDIREREKKDYDYKTLFFDVVSLGNSNRIKVLGPPMLNLRTKLGKPEFYDGNSRCKYKHRIGTFGRFEEWLVWNPISKQPIDTLTIVFPHGKTYTVQVNHVSFPQPGKKILTAIQKNNKVKWIRDWYNHYQKNFGINQLVLYDNGSDYFDELDTMLPESAIIVKWNFPYGPSISHGNKFTQIGALNHCRLVFGDKSTIFSFDIDEILVDNYNSILNSLNKYSVHYFSSYSVPFVKNLPNDYSFYSFKERSNKPTYTGKKYIYHSQRATGLQAHYVHEHRLRILDNLTILLRKGINAILWKNDQQSNWEVYVLRLIVKILTFSKKQKEYPITEAYFLHFMGITTDWKKRGNRLTPFTGDNLVDDNCLIKWSTGRTIE